MSQAFSCLLPLFPGKGQLSNDDPPVWTGSGCSLDKVVLRHEGDMDRYPERESDLIEQRHDIREVNPAVPVQVKSCDWLICRNPRHLVEVEHDIGKVQPPVAVEILVDEIPVRISGF